MHSFKQFVSALVGKVILLAIICYLHFGERLQVLMVVTRKNAPRKPSTGLCV